MFICPECDSEIADEELGFKSAPRGIGVCSTLLAFGILQDLRRPASQLPRFGLLLMTMIALTLGGIALNNAWTWADSKGPANRLTTRAFGVSLGYFMPALVASHALYFHWAKSVEAAFAAELFQLVKLLTRP